MAVIYFHRRKDNNEIFYVGIGKLKRAYENKPDRRNSIWNKIVSKTNYTIEIIHKNLSWENACELEKQYIKQYGRINNKTGILANMTDGGDGAVGVVVSKETKDKIVSTRRKNNSYNVSKETRKKLSKISKSQWSTMTKEQKEERNKKVSEANKGKVLSDETRKKISKNRKGIIFSEEHRKNLSLANIRNGNKPPSRKGISLTEEHKKKFIEAASKAKQKKVIQMDKQNNIIKVWDSIKEAAEALNISHGNISAVCRGVKHRPTAAGYKWKLVDEN